MTQAKQAVPPVSVRIPEEAFLPNQETAVYWLGVAGAFINSRGTTVLVDPAITRIPDTIFPSHGWLSEINGNRMLIDLPVEASHIRKLDAVLYTHSDDDHMGVLSAPMLKDTGCLYHATEECADKLRALGIPEDRLVRHPKLDRFDIGSIQVEMTIANHPWQSSVPEEYHGWHYTEDDCTGYKLHTQDGIIWLPGDSLLMDEHLKNTDVDLLFIDFSDDPFHFGKENALKLANALEQAEMIAYHWGTLDMPDFLPQNADPYAMRPRLHKPERLHILAAGEKFVL